MARRESDPDDRRKTLVRALPAVWERVAPLFEPMERSAMAVLAGYRDEELALLLSFLTSARDAALAAIAELRALPEADSPDTGNKTVSERKPDRLQPWYCRFCGECGE